MQMKFRVQGTTAAGANDEGAACHPPHADLHEMGSRPTPVCCCGCCCCGMHSALILPCLEFVTACTSPALPVRYNMPCCTNLSLWGHADQERRHILFSQPAARPLAPSMPCLG